MTSRSKVLRSTWLYCIVRSPRAPKAAGLRGVPGAGKVRVVEAGGSLWLVVADVPRDAWSAATIEAKLNDIDWIGAVAMGHEAVVESFVRAPALLPSKLFTLFHDDESAVAHVSRERRRIGRILDVVSRRVELGVRVALDEAKALRKAESDAKRASKGSTGAGFLMRKKHVQEVARAGGAAAQSLAVSMHEKLTSRAVDAVRKEITAAGNGAQSRLLLDAAYLVDAKKAPAFRRQAKALGRDAAREGLSLEVTGPWPAYHFSVTEAR
jgi:hypothetical protein